MANSNFIRHEFQQRFGNPIIGVQAPGRFNLIGEHTDYNLGWVMPGAIDKHLFFALGKGDNPSKVCMYSADFQEETVFDLHNFQVEKKVSWDNYLKAVIAELRAASYEISGINGVFGGNIPIGAGLSSSAALCCGLIFGISEMQGLDIPRKKIALLAQAAEHRIGLHCGLMDQYASLFGKAGHILCLDCKTLDFRYVPIVLKDHALVLFDSKIKHALAADSGYNDRRRSCENAVAHIRGTYSEVKSLRDVKPEMLQACREAISATDYRRALFILHENERVMHVAEALQQDDFERLGQLLWQAHSGLRKEYEVTAPETDLLADLAMSNPGVLGARQVGGGFGGCVLVLMKQSGMEAATAQIAAQYKTLTGMISAIYPICTEDGIRRWSL